MSWTVAEPGVIFICASMPSIWPLIRQSVMSSRHGAASSDSSKHPERSSIIRNEWSGKVGGSYSPNSDFIPLQESEGNSLRAFTHVGVGSRSLTEEKQDLDLERGNSGIRVKTIISTKLSTR